MVVSKSRSNIHDVDFALRDDNHRGNGEQGTYQQKLTILVSVQNLRRAHLVRIHQGFDHSEGKYKLVLWSLRSLIYFTHMLSVTEKY